MSEYDVLPMLAGPVLGGYLADRSVIEVLVNPNGSCFVERFGAGMQEAAPIAADDLDRFLAGVAHVVQQEWREQSPSLHAALPGQGWRIQAAGPPQAPGITMALRKHPQQIYTLEQYVHQGILSAAQEVVLRNALAQKQRLLISGATGSAKTSLANACLDVLQGSEERLVILEDDPELICTVRNAMFLRTRPGLSMTDLVKESLRYRPDRLIVGEIRDGAARAMCRAFETGHSGLATVHAESALGTLSRLEGLMQEGGYPPECTLIGSVIDLIIHMERSARSLTCTAIMAVDGYDGTQYQTRSLA